MLQVETNTRRRFAIMMGAFCLLIFGLMLSGLWQRFGAVNSASDGATDEINLAKARETAARARAVRKQLAALGKSGKWDEAAALAEASIREFEGTNLRRFYAEALYRAGRFETALQEYEEILAPFNPVEIADRFAIQRDTEGYRRHCEKLLSLPEAETTALLANNTAWACVTAKEGLTDYSRPVELARKAVAGATEETDRWTYLNTLGVALYRSGNDREAIERLMEAEKINSDAFNWPFLALAHHRQGNEKEARNWYTRYRKALDESYGTPTLSQSRHELLMFLREAEEIIAP